MRGLAPREGFDVVAAACEAARFGFAVASAGLGAGLMLFYPVPDRHLDEVTAAAPDPDPAVMAVVAPQVPALGDVIARRAADAEIIIAKPRLTPVADPAASVAALLRLCSAVALSLFDPGQASRSCNTWIALASFPARQGSSGAC